jgi:adenine-specific DNA-methyltransferase
VRYIGNKTRLIPFILDTVERLQPEAGVACDPFAGTASVSQALKSRGWTIRCGDLMAFSYALQIALVELDRTPRFRASLLSKANGAGVDRSWLAYGSMLEHLHGLPERHGFIREHFSPAGSAGARHGRMYFTPANAGAIDAIREEIAGWCDDGGLDRQRAQFLIATLVEAADRVANTTGVYASFVKSWQPNALREIELRPLRPTARRNGAGRCSAFLGEARDLVATAGSVDLLYLDPPYNERQYPAYYHLPELLSAGWNPPPTLRGKTGLIPDEPLRSDWCRKDRCAQALRALLEAADARHILLSYNDEGLLEAETIEHVLCETADRDSYRRLGTEYRRYRSDGDGPERKYRRDHVQEQLHYVRRG